MLPCIPLPYRILMDTIYRFDTQHWQKQQAPTPFLHPTPPEKHISHLGTQQWQGLRQLRCKPERHPGWSKFVLKPCTTPWSSLEIWNLHPLWWRHNYHWPITSRVGYFPFGARSILQGLCFRDGRWPVDCCKTPSFSLAKGFFGPVEVPSLQGF